MSKTRGKSTSKSRGGAAKDKTDDEQTRKGSAMAYMFLNKEDSEELLGLDAGQMESKIQIVFGLNPETDLKDAAILDYYVGATYWCKQQHFTAQQLSGFFSVVHQLLDKMKENQPSLVDSFKDFRKMLVGISSEPGPDVESGGLEFFTTAQATRISEYLHTSLFQHFKLFEFMFSQPQAMEIIGNDEQLSVEVPLAADFPFPPPLDEGITEDTHRDFLSIPTPSHSEQASGEKEPLEKPPTPIEVELPPEVKDIFAKLTPEDVRAVVEDVSAEILQNLQSGVDNKLRQYETNVLQRINKIHISLPLNKEEEEAKK